MTPPLAKRWQEFPVDNPGECWKRQRLYLVAPAKPENCLARLAIHIPQRIRIPSGRAHSGRPGTASHQPHTDSRFIAKRLFPGSRSKKSDQSTYQKNSLHNL